jgi:hypothetical protein
LFPKIGFSNGTFATVDGAHGGAPNPVSIPANVDPSGALPAGTTLNVIKYLYNQLSVRFRLTGHLDSHRCHLQNWEIYGTVSYRLNRLLNESVRLNRFRVPH